jgi:CRP-like cAMP-binding protein
MTRTWTLLGRGAFAAGETITEIGQPVDAILLLTSGTAKAEPQGFARSFRLGPGAVLGLHDVIFGCEAPMFRSRVTALEAVELARFELRDFRAEYGRLSDHVRAIFQSLFVTATALMHSYEATADRQYAELGALAREIAGLVAAEASTGTDSGQAEPPRGRDTRAG